MKNLNLRNLLKQSAKRLICLSPLALLNLTQACSNNDPSIYSSSQIKYALAPKNELSQSVLKDMYEKGQINFCLGFPDGRSVNESRVEKLKKEIHQLVQSWNSLLASQKNWPHQEIKTEFFVTSRCEDLSFANINFYQTQKSFLVACGPQLAHECRSHAYLSERVINMEPNLWSFEVMHHEFGHLLGLEDTYPEQNGGHSQFAVSHQPPSLMSGDVDDVTDDEGQGLNAILRFLQGKTLACGDGYKKFAKDRAGNLFCVPKQ